MSDLNPYVDLDNRKLTDATGAAFTLPTLVLADTAKFSLRGLRRTEDGVRTVALRLRSLKAGLGPILTAPTAGGAKLRFGGTPGDDETADVILFSATAAQVMEALTAVSDDWTPAEVLLADTACWLVRFEEQDDASPLQVGTVNTLTPRAFVRVRAYQLNGVWWHEVRFLQAPFAFASAFEEVLPPAPSIKRIRAGGSASLSDDIFINEIQSLVLPVNFRGTYVIARDGRQTGILGIEDGPDEIAAALNALWSDGKVRFAGTNVVADEAYIEFIGPLGDAGHDLMTVTVKSFEPGASTFTLNLATAELSAALRVSALLEKTTLVLNTALELELTYVAEDEDPDDDEIPSRTLSVQLAAKVVREQIYDELETVTEIDWLRPPSAKDYVPFTPDQVITGQQHYLVAIGNGASTSFAIAHNLDTEALSGFEVRENMSGGRVLGRTEYHIVIDSADQVTLTFAAAPTTNQYAVILTTAGPVSAFQAHTHTIGQIVGLQDIIDELTGRVSALEEMAPALTRALELDADTPAQILIPDISEIFPGLRLPAGADPLKPELLPRPPALLAAIHDASAVVVDIPLEDPAANAGALFVNDEGDDILVPGGFGQRRSTVADGGFLTADDRMWYALTRSGTTSSYYPTLFERELFILALSSIMWQPGGRFTVEFDVSLQLLRAVTRAQCVLVIESGTAPGQSSPGTTDPLNLSDIAWDATPLLRERIVITSLRLRHRFGVRIRRDAEDGLTADKLRYAAWTAADAVPSSVSLVLRARLIEWDTENSVPNATGYLYRALTGAEASIQ